MRVSSLSAYEERVLLWLTVESHVLGEGLGQNDVVTLFDEVTHGPGVAVDVSAGEALVRHVEEHEQVPLLRGENKNRPRWRSNLDPLRSEMQSSPADLRVTKQS